MDILNSAYQLLHHTTVPSQPLSNLDTLLFAIKGAVSLIGTLVILAGVVHSALRFIILKLFHAMAEKQQLSVDFIRRDLGRNIVLGLEFIVAGDVISTTITPDYYSLGILAIIVVIRTFLSLSLSKEINSLSPDMQSKLSE